MDRLAAMQLFIRVAELGSFSAAAQQLGLDRSVVTRQIAALEKHLGAKLMARSTRRLALTPAGTAYLEKCRVIVNLVDSAESELADEQRAPRGAIRLSLPLVFGQRRLAAVLLDFAQRYPQVALAMDFNDQPVKLLDEGIDLSIRISRQLAAGDVARRLGAVRLHAVASPEYLARHGRPRYPAELAHHQCLGYTAGGSLHRWHFLVDGHWQGVAVNSAVQANNGEVLAEAAALGLGITVQPDFIVDPLIAAGRLGVVLDEFPLPELGIHALLASNRQLPYRVRVLLDFLAAALANGPDVPPAGMRSDHPLATA